MFNQFCDLNMKKFCQDLPKVELHAHLGGSLSADTLKQLKVPPELCNSYLCNYSNSHQVFQLFKTAHDATKTRDSIYFATRQTIKEYDEDQVVYLELRTTPRQEDSMTKREYIETVIKAIKDETNERNIIVKLLLSIDRRHDSYVCNDNFNLIIEMSTLYPNVIKGVDLCGDPSKGTFDRELFAKFRRKGLKITLHCAELKNDQEVMDMLKFRPDRLGHAACLHPDLGGSKEIWQEYLSNPIPIEVCLTSNVICKNVKSFDEHHIKILKQLNLPFSINTDDKGVFNTYLSQEYYYAAKLLGLSKFQLIQLNLAAVDQLFASEEEKDRIRTILTNWKETTNIC